MNSLSSCATTSQALLPVTCATSWTMLEGRLAVAMYNKPAKRAMREMLPRITIFLSRSICRSVIVSSAVVQMSKATSANANSAITNGRWEARGVVQSTCTFCGVFGGRSERCMDSANLGLAQIMEMEYETDLEVLSLYLHQIECLNSSFLLIDCERWASRCT